MKYWMFQNNQVKGPYDPDDLSQVPGFSAESLVCPEGRKGTNMGDWQRASMMPELSVTLMKAAQLASAVKTGAAAGFFSSLPPEPTLKDLAALGSLQEKVSLLDNMLSHLQDNLRLKEDELLSLHKELEEKNRQAQELALKLGGVEERLAAVNALEEGLAKANEAERGLEDVIAKQHGTIEELTGKLKALESESADLKAQGAELKAQGAELKAQGAELKDKETELEKAKNEELATLKAELEELKKRPAPAPAPTIPSSAREALSPALGENISPLGEVKPAADAKPALQPAGLELKPTPLSADAPFGLSEPPPVGGLSASPFGAPPAGAGPTPIPLGPSPIPLGAAPITGPTPIPLGASPFGDPLAGSPPATIPFSPLGAPPPSAGPATPAPVTGDLTGKPPEKKKPNVVLIAAIGGLVLLGAAAKLHLLPGTKKKADSADRAPLPPPNIPAPAPEPVIPKGPTPEELLDQNKKAAIDLVKGWPVPAGTQTVGQALETQAQEPGGLSPWMAEQIKEGVFQVNFYSKSPRGMKTYEFEVNLGEKKVLAHNEPAAALLTPAKPAKGGKGKARAAKAAPAAKGQDEHMLEDLLQLPEDAGADATAPQPAAAQPAAAARPSNSPKKKKAAPKRDVNKELDDALSGPDVAPSKKAGPKKEESLDDLLVPGGGSGKSDLKEPQAAPDEGAAPADKPAPAKPAKKAAGKAEDAKLLDDLLNP